MLDYESRIDARLKPFAVVDKADNKELVGTTVSISGVVLEIGKDISLSELKYQGFDDLYEARLGLRFAKSNGGNLYYLINFCKVVGPESSID